ncbi:DciA family protein [Undibacterium sp. CY21W]|uniref:DciA family protein n=1 Tax=Undibacterium sp. CY21W TaxID=2762293 RepID=UPI00164B9A1E|nr:DciA family protein [Undibacterium sp. CY21W]MBC3928102.1 DUF721 domain-containing protein [Undibacterium sp. CY21W]
MSTPFTPSRPPYRINIKRGRPVMGATGAGDFLRSNDKISPLLPTIQRHLSLQKDCGAILPPIFDTCEVMQLADGLLTLSAPNAALATKLKQQCPKLLCSLQERGWQINAVRIKVQVKRVVEKAPPVKQLALSGKALQAFSTLEQNLENTSQNTDLLAALSRLLERHQQPKK